MKILISADMEGISGVVVWDQVTPEHSEYLQRFRSLMIGDVNAAIEGAFDGGATEVVVTDSHWYGLNLRLEDLDPRALLNSGLSSPLAMMQGVDRGVDGVVLVGCHPRSGTRNATLDHTWSDVRVHNVWLDGELVGEIAMNAALAGSFGVPVLAVSGDQNAVAEARELLGERLAMAVVKEATGQFSAECKPLAVSRGLIRDAVRQGVKNLSLGTAPAPKVCRCPVELRLEFRHSRFADRAQLMPGCERLDGRTVRFVAADVVNAWGAFRTLVAASRD